MKHKSLITLLALIMGAIPAMAATAPAVGVHLVQTTTPADTVFFRGPVTVEYQLTITNPTNAPITLTRLNLQSMGSGAYTLRTGDAPVKTIIPANGSTTLKLSAWARARGGFMRSTQPVDIHGVLWFQGPTGNFVKQFIEYLPQM
jgi:hypothetical protein